MDSLKISKLTRICLENHSTVTGWQELFFLYIRRIRRSKEEREKIKTREGGGGRGERGNACCTAPLSPVPLLLFLAFFTSHPSSLSEGLPWERLGWGTRLDSKERRIGNRAYYNGCFWNIRKNSMVVKFCIFFVVFFVYMSSKMLALAFIWSVRKPRLRLLTVETIASVQCCCLKSCTECGA